MAKSPRVQLVVDGKDNTKNAFGSVGKRLGALEQKTASVGRAMVGAFAGIISVSTLKNIGSINSEWVDMSSRLRRVTADEEEFSSVTERLGQVAESTWSGLNETIESFLSMRGPLADMGYTTEEQVNFVSALNNALVVSGAKKEVAASVQMALNKAMATGVLRGENLNTVIEKGGRVAELLASNLGVTVSELRDMGVQGKITGEVMYSALAGNMQLLTEEAEKMPATVEDAMQRVGESVKGAFRDEELMRPLTESLLELAEVLKDPEVRQGLASLAAGLAGAATAGVEALSELGDLAGSTSISLKKLGGTATDLEKLEHSLKQVDRSINNTGMSATLGSLTSKEELEKMRANLMEQINLIKSGHGEIVRLDKDIAQLRQRLAIPAMFEDPSGNRDLQIRQLIEQKEAERAILVAESSVTTAAMREEEEKRQTILKEEKAKEAAINRKYVTDIKTYNSQAVKAIKDRGKEMAKAEKEAAKEVEKAKSEVASVEKTFGDIRKDMATGGDKEPSFADYQSLAASANRAMTAGNTAKAKEDAIAAATVLKELQAAGENSYGFDGMVNSMSALARSAAEIDQANAEAKLLTIQQEMKALALQAKELESMPINFELDSESLENTKAQISAALEAMKIEAVIPVRVAMTGTEGGEPQGFATGGHIRGAGTGTSDSILARLSNGEYVIKAAAVKKYGLQTLHAMNNMNMPKFAGGGLVGTVANISPQAKSIGTLNFNLPGGDNFSVDVAGTSSLDDLHRAALKFGRTRN